MIAAKNHKNGVGNPYAQLRKDLATSSAVPRVRKILSSPVRSNAPIVLWFPMAQPPSCSPMSRRRSR